MKITEDGEGAPSVALQALDALGLALTEHGHEWTDEERGLYEEATNELCATDPEPEPSLTKQARTAPGAIMTSMLPEAYRD